MDPHITNLHGSCFLWTVTFAILGEKTTVMSPEVFISAGVPCCRYLCLWMSYYIFLWWSYLVYP